MKRFSLAMVAVAVVVLVSGSAFGGADPGGNALRDHGHGAWFKRVCDLPFGSSAGCDAQVVTDSAGDPLAGGSPPSSAYGPPQFHGAYNLPTSATGGATPTVGIVDAYDDPNAEADLATFDDAYGLPACTTANGCFRKVNQSGGTSYPAANSGWDLEISLDVQTVREICQSCRILLVEASSNSVANLGAAENEAAQLGAVAISNSWGSGESSSQTSWDSAYFNHPGVAITASTGDSGFGVEWPASSPNVTAVGGTTLLVDGNNNYAGENAWVGGGSGCSTIEAKPSWQAGTGSCPNRSVADVAADADPNTGAAVYDSVPYSGSSGWFQVGGTSLASPLIASVYALADNTSTISNGSTAYAYLGTGALHDVTSGNNGSCNPSYLCTAGPGYDGPTGVGTPNGDTAFSPTPPPPPNPDFSLGISSQSTTVTSGTGGTPTYTVTVNDLNDFAGAVTLSAGTLPGVSAALSPPSTSATSTLTLTVAATVAPNTYTIPITGVSGSLSHSINATLTVAPPPDFSLSVGSQVGTVNSGTSGSVAYTLTVHDLNGFSGSVTLSTTTFPAGVTLSGFSPNPATTTSTLTLVVSSTAAPGTFTIPITGSSGVLDHSVNATLTVGSMSPPDFSLSISPSSRTIGPGGSTSYTVTIKPTNNFTGTVSLSVTGLPRNVSGSFSPSSVTGGSGTSTLTVTATSRAKRSNATLSVRGTSGSLSHTATASLSVS